MKLANLWVQVAFAVAGGVVAEFLHWYMLSRKPEGIGPYLPKPEYWFFTAGMIILGGLMPVLYISDEASALLCFHLGATAPIALQKLFAGPPEGTDGNLNLVRRQGSLRRFMSW
jgi:hypothetical protein